MIFPCIVHRGSQTHVSLEAAARIILTGLIIDPQSTFADVWNSIHRRWRSQAEKDPVQRVASRTRRAAWQEQDRIRESKRQRRKSTLLSEAPFQNAVARQRDLAHSNRPYLRHSWHRIDLLSITCFWISFLLALSHNEATPTLHLYIFRALSVLRCARLLVITSGTATILRSLKRAGPLLVTVGFFFLFASALWSIIGIQSFQGSFRRQCTLGDPNNASNLIELGQPCGGHINQSDLEVVAYLTPDGEPFGAGSKGYICPLGQICQVC